MTTGEPRPSSPLFGPAMERLAEVKRNSTVTEPEGSKSVHPLVAGYLDTEGYDPVDIEVAVDANPETALPVQDYDTVPAESPRAADNSSDSSYVQVPSDHLLGQPGARAADKAKDLSGRAKGPQGSLISSLSHIFSTDRAKGDKNMTEATGGTPASSQVAISEDKRLGRIASIDAEYARKLTDAATTNRYQFLPRAREDAATLMHEVVPQSILDSPAGPTLVLAAAREAEGFVLHSGQSGLFQKAGDWAVSDLGMPNKAEYSRNQRKLEAAELAGRKGVEAIVDLKTKDDSERSLQSVKRGLGALGIPVHVNTLRNRYEVDGLLASQRLVEASSVLEDGATYRDSALRGIYIGTDEAVRPGGQVKDFQATLLIRDDSGSRQLVSMSPVSTQSAGREREATLVVEGIGINPEIADIAVNALRDRVVQERTELGSGASRVTYSEIAADLHAMVEDLVDPQHVGVRTARITPGGSVPFEIESRKVADSVVDGEVVDDEIPVFYGS